MRLYSCQVFRQPIGNYVRHPRKIFPLRELMVGAGQQLQVFLHLKRVIKSPALVKRYVFVLIALDNDGRRGDLSRRFVGNPA